VSCRTRLPYPCPCFIYPDRQTQHNNYAGRDQKYILYHKNNYGLFIITDLTEFILDKEMIRAVTENQWVAGCYLRYCWVHCSSMGCCHAKQ